MAGGESGIVEEDFEIAILLGFHVDGCGGDGGGKGYIELEAADMD